MVSVVIPNWNGVEHLDLCFASLYKQTYKDIDIILVDNNSSDTSVKFTRKNYPDIKILQMDRNTGFAKAVNEGINFSLNYPEIEYILILNNDIECDENFIEEMLKGFTTKDTGSVACKMLNFYNRMMIDDAGDFIKKKGSPYARGHGEIDQGQYDEEGFILGACGGAAIFKKEVFDEVGLFDEDFFAYYEDIDFSLRLQLGGYKCFYNPKAVCYHKRGATTKDATGFQTMLCEKNLVALRVKNYPFRILLKYLPYFFFVRFRRYNRFRTEQSSKVFWSAVKGYFKGLKELPGSLSKRKKIQKNMKVKPEYIESLFTP